MMCLGKICRGRLPKETYKPKKGWHFIGKSFERTGGLTNGRSKEVLVLGPGIFDGSFHCYVPGRVYKDNNTTRINIDIINKNSPSYEPGFHGYWQTPSLDGALYVSLKHRVKWIQEDLIDVTRRRKYDPRVLNPIPLFAFFYKPHAHSTTQVVAKLMYIPTATEYRQMINRLYRGQHPLTPVLLAKLERLRKKPVNPVQQTLA